MLHFLDKNISVLKTCQYLLRISYLAVSNSLKLWRLNQRLDDSCVSGHDRENHTGQKHQSQFVHIPAERRGINVSLCAGVCWCVVRVCGYLLHPYKHD